MAGFRQRHWAQWVWLAAGIAVATRIGFIFLGGDPVPAPPGASPGQPGVTVVSEDGSSGGALVAEQIVLLDQKPLSLPTKWNAGARQLPDELRRQPGQVFGIFNPRLVFESDRLDPVFAPRGGAPADGIGGLRLLGPMAEGCLGLGRVDRPISPFPEREAAIEVVGFSGREVEPALSAVLVGLPESVTGHDWVPLEFSIVVSAGGLVGGPTLVRGSGVESIDSFFASYLVRDFHLGARVLPGLYRVRIVR